MKKTEAGGTDHQHVTVIGCKTPKKRVNFIITGTGRLNFERNTPIPRKFTTLIYLNSESHVIERRSLYVTPPPPDNEKEKEKSQT